MNRRVTRRVSLLEAGVALGTAMSATRVVSAQVPRPAGRADLGARPAWSTRSVNWPGEVGAALKVATEKMREVGLKIEPHEGWERVGTSDHVAAFVACGPQGQRKTRVFIVVTSTNPGTARSTADQLQRLISKAPAPVRID